MKNYRYFVDNKIYQSDLKIVGHDVHDGSEIGFVHSMPQSIMNGIFKKAHLAFLDYKNTPLLERVKLMKAWTKTLLERSDEMAQLMALEIGKSVNSGKKEILRSIDYINYTIEECLRLHPECYSGDANSSTDSKFGIFERYPLGVILAISPFNYPINLAISKIAPALIMGNTVVLKPPTAGTLSSTLLAKTLYDAGFKNNIFNLVVIKGRDAGNSLINNEKIKVINFTGSSKIGHMIAKESRFAQLIMELGGKDPALVLRDADLKLSAKKIIQGAFSYNGQRCTAIKRVLVDATIADDLVKYMQEEIQKLTIGSALDNCAITPVIDGKTLYLAQELIADTLEKGGKVVTGNKFENNLIYPTLIDHVNLDMRLAWEEPFAPLLPIIRLQNEEEMLRVANQSEYGLQASIFTNNLKFAFMLAKKIETGTVHINSFSERGPDYFPFTGIKDSGINVQGIRNALLSVSTTHGIVVHYNN